MKGKKEIDITIGERLLQFLDAIGMSMNSLGKITGISQSTLSRIDRNPDRIMFRNIKILSEAFGVSTIQFQDGNFAIPNKKILIASLQAYSKAKNKDVNVKLLIEGSKTAHFLDKYINENFLDEYKSMSEIRKEIKNQYNVELNGSQLSKLLGKRYDWQIVNRITGEKKGTFKYKRTLQSKNKEGIVKGLKD